MVQGFGVEGLGLGFGVSREYGNILIRGIICPYSLLRTSKESQEVDLRNAKYLQFCGHTYKVQRSCYYIVGNWGYRCCSGRGSDLGVRTWGLGQGLLFCFSISGASIAIFISRALFLLAGFLPEILNPGGARPCLKPPDPLIGVVRIQ